MLLSGFLREGGGSDESTVAELVSDGIMCIGSSTVNPLYIDPPHSDNLSTAMIATVKPLEAL